MSYSYLSSSIGKKQIMAITGLGLAGFVLMHMAGNLLLFIGPDTYNFYSHKLISNPLIYLAEVGLILFFLFHIVKGIIVTVKNRAARVNRYAVTPNGEKRPLFASKTMIHQGIVLTVFVVHHLITFKFGPYYETTVDGVVMRDLYRLVMEVFQSPLYVIWYIVATALVGVHLSHGVYSALQSLGYYNPRKPFLTKHLSIAYGIVISLGFISQPIFAYLQS